MTVPDDWPQETIWNYLDAHHRGYENAGCLKSICSYLRISERRFREWLEAQRDYPIATNDRGVWVAVVKADWHPMLRWRARRLVAERRALDRAKWMMKHFHPRHGQLFDDEQYGRAA